MKYLVILDNGEEYSAHVHMPLTVCDTEEQAKTYIAPFAEYVERYKEAFKPLRKARQKTWNAEFEKFAKWEEENPSPRILPSGFRMSSDVHMSVLPIPEYLA